MAIRVAGAQPPVPTVPEDFNADSEDYKPVPEQEEAVSKPAVMREAGEPGKVSPDVARYMTSDMGPFICAFCDHYRDGSCEIVSGPIDPEGVCILFTPHKEAEESGTEEAAEPPVVEEVENE